MKNLLLAFLALALLPTTSFAFGDGGTTTNQSINFTNNGTDSLAVIVDAPKGYDPKRKTVTQFKADGGKILNAGESASFPVLIGKHSIGAAFVSSAGVIGKNSSQHGIQVREHEAVSYGVTGAYNNAPTITAK